MEVHPMLCTHCNYGNDIIRLLIGAFGHSDCFANTYSDSDG